MKELAMNPHGVKSVARTKNTEDCDELNGTGTKPCRRDLFGIVAAWTARAAGNRWTTLGALLTVIVWAACGPYFEYSETWQLVINTGTTIVTFLMVFLIQNSQNRESKALHLKLDELIHAVKRADNQMINVESLTEEQLDMLARRYERISRPLHEKLQSAVQEVSEEIEQVGSHLRSREGLDSRLDRNVPTTSRTDPTASVSRRASSS
jgi:low affinity Fe/Cu permease